MVRQALARVTEPDPMTAAFRARLGLTTLDLTADRPTAHDADLRSAVIAVAVSDAYAARDVHAHHGIRSRMTPQQEEKIASLRALLDTTALQGDLA